MIQSSIRQLQASEGGGDERDRPDPFDPGATSPGEDLPYRVDVWDETGRFPERIIAITASASIGYAAFYAAARQQPGRVVTLSCNGAVLSRWTGQVH